MEVPLRTDYNPGDLISQRYLVEKSLGEGAFGQVLKVRDCQSTDNKVYALKLLRLWDVPSDLRQPLIDRFKMEFETGQINSHYLVRSFDYGFAKGNPYIVMEFCPGGDMSKCIGHPEYDVIRYAANVLHGLHDLHINGKVHRDLKPENVLFREDDTAVLTDFGICGDRNKRMTERNIFGKPYQMFGTYAYMPPEQVNRARGQATVLPTTDIFSFGVMMFQILTGELPFGKLEEQSDLIQYQKRGKSGDWDSFRLNDVRNSKEWYSIISGCLKPDLRERTNSAKSIIEKLVTFYHPIGGNVALPNDSFAISVSPIAQTDSPKVDNNNSVHLRIMQGEDYGRTINVSDLSRQLGRNVLTIGRHESNNIPIMELQSCYISRFHCTLEYEPECNKLLIRDGQWLPSDRVWQKSTNGTFVNSIEVQQQGFFLEDMDIITIGDVKIRVEFN